ncbi:MAG: hypothetical protein JXQ87_07130 [Bacteroidia bacterium]
MKTLKAAFPIVPVKKFIFPRGTYSIVINNALYYEQLHDSLLLNKEIGVPFWFCEDFNVYGCSAKVLSVYQNEKKGFTRVKVEGLKLFRITKYSKRNLGNSLNEADVNILDFEDEKIVNPSIIHYFSKITETEIYGFNPQIKLLELLNWLNLRPELSVAVISRDNQEEREQLLTRILKFLAVKKSQKSIYQLN